jgi:hypothetical protein
LDQGASWCILGNSWSDIGTKCWSRLVQVPLVLTLKRGRMQEGGWYHNSVKTSIFKILLILLIWCTQATTVYDNED